MKKKGIKKYFPGVEGLLGATGTSAPITFEKANELIGKHGKNIAQAAGSLMPLLMKKPDPNAKPYKKGSKLIKYQIGTEKLLIDKDSVKVKTPQGNIATGATVEERGAPTTATTTNTNTITEKKKETAPAETAKFKSLAEGLGMSKGQEVGTVGVMSAIGSLFPDKSKLGWIGSSLKNILKYGPTVTRNVHDLVFEAANKGVDNINWKERLGNMLQDASVGTTASGLARTAKGTVQNVKKQIVTAATKNPDKEVIKPISFKEAAGKGAQEAVNKSLIVSGPAKAVKSVKNTIKKGKVAMGNISQSGAMQEAAKIKFKGVGDGKIGKKGQHYFRGKPVSETEFNTLAKERKEKYENITQERAAVETNRKNATETALKNKHTGPGNSSKGLGIEGKFYVDGKEVSKEAYREHYNKSLEVSGAADEFKAEGRNLGGAASTRQKFQEKVKPINDRLNELRGTGDAKKKFKDLTPAEQKEVRKLLKEKKPLVTSVKETTAKIKAEAPGKAAAKSRQEEAAAIKAKAEQDRLAAEAAAKKAKDNEGKKAALEKARAAKAKAKEAADKAKAEAEKKKINFKQKPAGSTSSKTSSKTTNKTSNKTTSSTTKKKTSTAEEYDPTDDAIDAIAESLGMGRK
jgi:hypothetical protein